MRALTHSLSTGTQVYTSTLFPAGKMAAATAMVAFLQKHGAKPDGSENEKLNHFMAS